MQYPIPTTIRTRRISTSGTITDQVSHCTNERCIVAIHQWSNIRLISQNSQLVTLLSTTTFLIWATMTFQKPCCRTQGLVSITPSDPLSPVIHMMVILRDPHLISTHMVVIFHRKKWRSTLMAANRSSKESRTLCMAIQTNF